jgi:hypothetical protein
LRRISPAPGRDDAAQQRLWERIRPLHVWAFGAWVEVDGGGTFRDEGVAVVADCVDEISFGFADEISKHDALSEGAGVAKGGHWIVVRHDVLILATASRAIWLLPV